MKISMLGNGFWVLFDITPSLMNIMLFHNALSAGEKSEKAMLSFSYT